MSSCLGDARGIASLAVASVSVLSCIVDLFGTEIGKRKYEEGTREETRTGDEGKRDERRMEEMEGR